MKRADAIEGGITVERHGASSGLLVEKPFQSIPLEFFHKRLGRTFDDQLALPH